MSFRSGFVPFPPTMSLQFLPGVQGASVPSSKRSDYPLALHFVPATPFSCSIITVRGLGCWRSDRCEQTWDYFRTVFAQHPRLASRLASFCFLLPLFSNFLAQFLSRISWLCSDSYLRWSLASVSMIYQLFWRLEAYWTFLKQFLFLDQRIRQCQTFTVPAE